MAQLVLAYLSLLNHHSSVHCPSVEPKCPKAVYVVFCAHFVYVFICLCFSHMLCSSNGLPRKQHRSSLMWLCTLLMATQCSLLYSFSTNTNTPDNYCVDWYRLNDIQWLRLELVVLCSLMWHIHIHTQRLAPKSSTTIYTHAHNDVSGQTNKQNGPQKQQECVCVNVSERSPSAHHVSPIRDCCLPLFYLVSCSMHPLTFELAGLHSIHRPRHLNQCSVFSLTTPSALLSSSTLLSIVNRSSMYINNTQ